MNERIRQVRKENGLTLEKFGKRIGITAASCSTIESGKSNPSNRTVLAICREFGISETWLRTGSGDMYSGKKPEETDQGLWHVASRLDSAHMEQLKWAALAIYAEQRLDGDFEKLLEKLETGL